MKFNCFRYYFKIFQNLIDSVRYGLMMQMKRKEKMKNYFMCIV